ncbi:MAG: HEAT repeat domain-containing protein [Planctomycetes bacterium]|nr:HEAT repeat domain-containing protein [Planctomycetota bacterium]
MHLLSRLLAVLVLFAAAFAPLASGVVRDQEADEVARLQALAAIPDTDEAARARARLVVLARGSEAKLADAAVEALGAFGRHADGALEEVIRLGAALSARQRALELRLARRTPAEAPWFARLAGHDLPVALRLLALDGVGDEPAALQELERLLRSAPPPVQTRALRMLGAVRSPAAVAFAHEVLGAEARRPIPLQVAAIDTLREERSRAAIERLIDVAAQQSGEVREFAFKSLLVMERGAVMLALQPMLDPQAAPARTLVALEAVARFDLSELPELRSALRSTLGHGDSEVRAAALRAVAAIGDREALAPLERATLDPDPLVAVAAIEAVSRLRRGEPAWNQRLRQLARSRLPLQRVAATQALADADDPTLEPLLRELLDDDSWRVREQAARGLGRLRSVAAVAPLIELVANERRRVRLAAAAALRRISGMPFTDLASDWRRWWADQGDGFVPPPLAEVEAMELRLATNRARATTRASFYGLPIESDHLALVVDVSGSMGSPEGTGERTKLDVAKDEVCELIRQLEPGAELNLLFFSDHVRRWKRGLCRVDRASMAHATAFVRAQKADGSTNLHEALLAALDDPDVDTVYVLSDGAPTVGRVTDPALLRAEVRHRNVGGRVRLNAISIGGQSPLLRHLAEDSGGSYVDR